MGLQIKKRIVGRASQAMDSVGLDVRQKALVFHFADQMYEQILAGSVIGARGARAELARLLVRGLLQVAGLPRASFLTLRLPFCSMQSSRFPSGSCSLWVSAKAHRCCGFTQCSDLRDQALLNCP